MWSLAGLYLADAVTTQQQHINLKEKEDVPKPKIGVNHNKQKTQGMSKIESYFINLLTHLVLSILVISHSQLNVTKLVFLVVNISLNQIANDSELRFRAKHQDKWLKIYRYLVQANHPIKIRIAEIAIALKKTLQSILAKQVINLIKNQTGLRQIII